MTSVPSATTWGSPAATKHALLIHGTTSTSHTWHRVAPALVAQGYFVTAPNFIGHASRVATDYHLSSIAEDLRPYLAARDYSLIIGHSVGALTTMAIFSYLPRDHPTAVLLVDPPMRSTPENLDFIDGVFSDWCINIKSADTYRAENLLWSREDGIYREFGTRLCAVEAVHGILKKNRPWHFFNYLDTASEKWKVTILVADPVQTSELCVVDDFKPYPHVRSVMVPGAGHWIHYDFPEVIVDEAMKTVAELELATDRHHL